MEFFESETALASVTADTGDPSRVFLSCRSLSWSQTLPTPQLWHLPFTATSIAGLDAVDKSPEAFICRGMTVGARELTMIRAVLNEMKDSGRTGVSLELCRRFNFNQPNGWPKDRAMRDILKRLESRGLITLPISRKPASSRTVTARRNCPVQMSAVTKVETMIEVVHALKGAEARLWDQLIAEHHYLGRRPLVGRNLRQLIMAGDRPIACLAWSDPCLKLAPRDGFLKNTLISGQVDLSQGVKTAAF